jgi:hypothetical protein
MFTRSIRFALTLLIVGLSMVGARPAAAQSTTADVVYGQFGSFTTGAQNNGGISANSLSTPTGSALDSSGNLYVADETNNRVLFYPSGSTTATRVYGQLGSFTTNTANNGGISANSLYDPQESPWTAAAISTWPTRQTRGCCSIPPAAPPPRGSTGRRATSPPTP